MVANDWKTKAKFPHCDQRVLHKPGACEFCDAYPDRQELRTDWKIAFTGEVPKEGELPCPSDAARGRGGARVWGGNRPLTPAQNPTNETARNPTQKNEQSLTVDVPIRIPLWKCRACGCLWRDNLDGTVSLFNADQQSCPTCEWYEWHTLSSVCDIYWHDAVYRLPREEKEDEDETLNVILTAAGPMCAVCEHGVDCWLASDVSPCNESCVGYRARMTRLWQKRPQDVPGKPGVYIGGCSSIFAKKPDVAPVDRSNVCTTSGERAADVRERQKHEGNDGQHSSYITLCDTERKKGFVRPVRASYKHVGERPTYPLRPLTQEEQVRYADAKYVVYEMYPKPLGSVLGRFWTAQQLQGGCQTVTTMGLALAETYARDPKFYGSTFCCHCNTHRPVAEFVWLDDETVVGS